MGGSAPAMANQIAEGYILMSANTLRGFAPGELMSLRVELEKLQRDSTVQPGKLKEQELNAALAEAKHAALLASLKAEQLEDENRKDSSEWTAAAKEAAAKEQNGMR